MYSIEFFTRGGQTYETPSVKTLEIWSEGLLCGSYGDAGEAGKELHETNVWDL